MATLGPNLGAPVMCAIVVETDPKRYRVDFESFVPSGIVEGYQANFSPASGRGAPQPAWRRWTGGDWNPMQFDLEFRAGSITQNRSVKSNSPAGIAETLNELASTMEKKVRLIQAMSFPKPDSERTANQKLLPPAPLIPFVLILFGDFITYRGYITNTQITWKEPWHPVSARPLAALVSVTFQPVMAFYPDFYDAQNPQMRGSVVNAISAAENGVPSTLGDTFRRREALNNLNALKGRLADANRELSKLPPGEQEAFKAETIDPLQKEVDGKQQAFDAPVKK